MTIYADEISIEASPGGGWNVFDLDADPFCHIPPELAATEEQARALMKWTALLVNEHERYAEAFGRSQAKAEIRRALGIEPLIR